VNMGQRHARPIKAGAKQEPMVKPLNLEAE
jgi:hypothetical protein